MSEGHRRQTASRRDPLAELLDVLSDDASRDEWRRRWDTPDTDALTRAWSTSTYVPGLIWVLENAGVGDVVTKLAAGLHDRHLSGEHVDVCATLRAALPRPPPLERLIARHTARVKDLDVFGY